MDSSYSGTTWFYGWAALSMAGLVMFVVQGLTYSFQVFLPILSGEFGWSRATIGGAASLSTALVALTAPIAGLFIAKYGARRAMVAGNLMVTAGFLLLFFHTEIWQLYLGFGVLVGVGSGLGGLLPSTTLANNWFVRKRSMAMGSVTASSSIGGFVFLPVTTLIVADFGWRPAFLAISASALIFTVLIPWIIVRNGPEDIGQVPDGETPSKQGEDSDSHEREPYTTPVDFTLGEAVRTRALWMLVCIVVTVGFAQSIMYVHQIAFLETRGITGMVAATAVGLMSGMGVVGALAVAILGLRFDIWPVSIVTLAMTTIGMSLTLVTSSTLMVFLYNIIFGTGLGAFFTCFFCIFSSYFGRTNYPKILGATVPIAATLGASGALIAGVMYDATGSYMLPFAIGVVALLTSSVLITLAQPPQHPSLSV